MLYYLGTNYKVKLSYQIHIHIVSMNEMKRAKTSLDMSLYMTFKTNFST